MGVRVIIVTNVVVVRQEYANVLQGGRAMLASNKPFVPSMGVKNVQDTENASLAYVNVRRDGLVQVVRLPRAAPIIARVLTMGGALVPPSSKTRHALAGECANTAAASVHQVENSLQIVEHRRNVLVMITEICVLELVYV